MRVLGVVPARAGSTRAPGKNLAVVGGKTLVRRALEVALASGCFAQVVLTSDSDAILDEADGLAVRKVRRPPELATADAPVAAALLHVLDELGEEFDAVAIVQATSPFTMPEDVAGTVALLDETGADAAVSVVCVDDVNRAWPIIRAPGDRFAPNESRNGSVFVYRRAVVENGLSADDVRGYRMPAERSLDIDTPADLELALRSDC
jgi:CMP-N-acetylneuraminic acid synthetase